MDGSYELLAKAALSVAAAALLAWRARRPRPRRVELGAMLLLSAAAIAAYYNGFRFHGGSYVHHWEMFHYALGSKYFEELGYDGIYAASLAAQRESSPSFPLPERIRDLRTGEVVRPQEIFDHALAVRARFTDGRWEEFVGDNEHFLEACGAPFLERIRRDHGFNATPGWTAMTRPLVALVPLDANGLAVLGALDPLLLLLGLAVLYRTFGVATASAAVFVFGFGFLHRFYWIGGAFLRIDWLVATLLAFAALERRRLALGGALLGVAFGLRLFPALFVVGPLAAALADRTKPLPREPSTQPHGTAAFARLSVGFAAGAAAMIVSGALAGRGFAAWLEFARHIGAHASGWLNNNVGLRQCVVHLFHLAQQPYSDWGTHMAGSDWSRRVEELRAVAPWAAPLVAVPFVVLTARASLRATPAQAAVYGLATVFAVTQPTCYYWGMLMLVPLAGGTWPTVAVLLIGAGFHTIAAFFSAGSGQGSTVYGIACWVLALFFLGWLGPKARKAGAAYPLPEPASSTTSGQ